MESKDSRGKSGLGMPPPNGAQSIAAGGGGAAGAGGVGSVSLIHKLSKKIAQLTKVIHVLNTKADEHAYRVELMESSHAHDIESFNKSVAELLTRLRTRFEELQRASQQEGQNGGSNTRLLAETSAVDKETIRVLKATVARLKDEKQATEDKASVALKNLTTSVRAELREEWRVKVGEMTNKMKQEVLEVRSNFEEKASRFDAAIAALERKHKLTLAEAEAKAEARGREVGAQQSKDHVKVVELEAKLTKKEEEVASLATELTAVKMQERTLSALVLSLREEKDGLIRQRDRAATTAGASVVESEKRCQALEATVSTLKETITSLRQSIEKASMQMQDQEQTISRLISERDGMTEVSSVLKSRAEAAEAAHAVTAAELSALQSTTRDQQQLVASLQATVTSLQATIAEQKAQLLAAKESSVQAVARKEALAAAARKVASLESDLATSTAQLKDAQESLEKEKKKSKEAKKKADADAEKLANDYAVAKTRLSQLEEEKAKLSEQLRDALTKDSSLASSAETALQGLRQELDNVRAQSVAAERRHEETVRTMQTGREAAEARIKDLQASVTSVTSSLSEARSDLTSAKEAAVNAQTKSAQLATDLERTLSQLEAVKRELGEAKAALEGKTSDVDQRVRTLEAAEAAALSEAAQLKEKVAAAEAGKAVAVAERTACETKVRNVQAALDEKTRELATALQSLDALNKDVMKLRSELAKKEAERVSLEARIREEEAARARMDKERLSASERDVAAARAAAEREHERNIQELKTRMLEEAASQAAETKALFDSELETKLAAANARWTKELDSVKASLEGALVDVAAKAQAIKTRDADIEGLKTQRKEVEAVVVAKEGEIRRLEAEARRLGARQLDAETKIRTLEANLQDVTERLKELHALRQEIKNRDEALRERDSIVTDRDSKIRDNERELLRREKEALELKRSVQKLEDDTATLEADVQRLEDIRGRLSGDVVARDKVISQMKEDLTCVHGEFENKIEKMQNDFRQEKESLILAHAVKLSQCELLIKDLNLRLENRESRPEDVAAIQRLQAELGEAEKQRKRAQEEAKYYKLELINREDNFNKTFGSGGGMRPTVAHGVPGKTMNSSVAPMMMAQTQTGSVLSIGGTTSTSSVAGGGGVAFGHTLSGGASTTLVRPGFASGAPDVVIAPAGGLPFALGGAGGVGSRGGGGGGGGGGAGGGGKDNRRSTLR